MSFRYGLSSFKWEARLSLQALALNSLVVCSPRTEGHISVSVHHHKHPSRRNGHHAYYHLVSDMSSFSPLIDELAIFLWGWARPHFQQIQLPLQVLLSSSPCVTQLCIFEIFGSFCVHNLWKELHRNCITQHDATAPSSRPVRRIPLDILILSGIRRSLASIGQYKNTELSIYSVDNNTT